VFQSPRPHEARLAKSLDEASARGVFQSPRPHEARQDSVVPTTARGLVSIPAPARGATPQFGGLL